MTNLNIPELTQNNTPFFESMDKAIKSAKDNDKLCYVYLIEGEYRQSFTWFDDWVFRVYPGGRKELSIRGKRILENDTHPESG